MVLKSLNKNVSILTSMMWNMLAASLLLVARATAYDILPVIKSPEPFPDVYMPYISPVELDNAFAEGESGAVARTNIENNLAKYDSGGYRAKATVIARAGTYSFTRPPVATDAAFRTTIGYSISITSGVTVLTPEHMGFGAFSDHGRRVKGNTRTGMFYPGIEPIDVTLPIRLPRF